MAEPVYLIQIRFPASLKKAVEKHCVQTGQSINKFTLEAVRAYLTLHNESKQVKK